MIKQSKDNLPHFLLREVDALQKLQGHQNIVQLLDVYRHQCEDIGGLLLVFEYLEGGDLDQYIWERYKDEGMPIDLVIDFTH